MPERRVRTVRWLLAVVLLAAVAACSEPSDSAVEPSCEEELLASGTGYRHDPAFAIAIAHGIAARNTDLAGVVDAVAEFQMEHPDYEALVSSPDSTSADVGLDYVLALVILTAEPDLATPAVLDTMERAADEGGMGGIHFLVNGERHPMGEDAGVELQLLRDRLVEPSVGVRDQIAALPGPACPHDDPGR